MEQQNELPLEWSQALSELYGKYNTNPNDSQKLAILIATLGDCNFSYIGEYRDSDDMRTKMKIHYMELEYLMELGLYKPDFH